MKTNNPLPGEWETSIWLIGNEGREEVFDLLATAGYQCHTFTDSGKALEWIRRGSALPDVLIVLNGEDAGWEAIRAASDGYVPVLIVGEQKDVDSLDSYQQAGIDTFIARPVNPCLLGMNIRLALRLRGYEANYRQQMDLEQEIAETIYRNVLQSHYLHTEVIKSALPPMALFSGDLLLVERTPDNHLHVFLGDFSCHGLSASVVALPVSSIFYGMSQKGFAMADIVREINAKLHKMLPINQFLAATAATLYPNANKLGLISCGLPNPVLVNDLDGSYSIVESKNIPLGVYSSIELEEQNFTVSQHHHLYLMTDGMLDAENIDGEAFGMARVIDAARGRSGFDALQISLDQHIQGTRQKKDDISLVELVCDVDNVPWQSTRTEQAPHQIQALNWKTAMEFGVDALRILNPVPVMVNALMEIQGLQEHRQSIFLIISELFANALDHGVLGLDSAIKATPEGFMRFYELKEERMQSLRQGKIRLLFAHSPTGRGGRLTIKVSDSGDGFDWRSKQYQNLDNNTGFSGRGLGLLETLCTRLTFHGKGNRVTAVFDWHR